MPSNILRRLIILTFVFRERKANPIWYFVPPENYRLTEQNITDFVNCVKECAFIAIFTKAQLKEAAKACQYLSMLRPELIVPPIVEKFAIKIQGNVHQNNHFSILGFSHLLIVQVNPIVLHQ